MFEITDLESFFGGFASAVTIIVAAIGFFGWLIARSKLVYVENVRHDFGVHNIPKEFSVEYSSHGQTAAQAVVDFHLVSNRCAINLTDEDFVHQIHVPYVTDGTVFYAKIREGDASGDASIDIDSESVSVSNLFLPRKKGLIIEIGHDGCLSRQIRSAPKAIPDFRSKSHFPLFDNPFYVTPLLIVLMGYTLINVYFGLEESGSETGFWQGFGLHIAPMFFAMFVLSFLSYGILKRWTLTRKLAKALGTTEIENEFIAIKYELKRKP